MSFEVIDGGAPQDSQGGQRILTPGAPPSPGPIPNELAQHLQHGEVLVWWGEKTGVQLALVSITLGAAAIALLLVTGFAPTFWSQPPAQLWRPLLALLSPTLFVLAREWVGRRALLVTNNAIIEVPRGEAPRRLALGGIARVRRDWLRGGLRVEGRNTVVQVPTFLMEDAGAAVRSRLRGKLRAPDRDTDPLRWLS